MISQLFFVTVRGDTIMKKDYRKELPASTPETFFRRFKLEGASLPPVFQEGGVTFFYSDCSSFCIVATCIKNTSPALVFCILARLKVVISDICGVLDEKNMRKNFATVYEIVDEMLDFGNPQTVETLEVGKMVDSEVRQDGLATTGPSTVWGMLGFKEETKDKNCTQLTVQNSKQKDIFIDVYEHVGAIVRASGVIVKSDISAEMRIKCYLENKMPLKVILDPDLSIQESKRKGVELQDYRFCNTVNYDEFEVNRSFLYHASKGSDTIFKYRVDEPARLPFKVFPIIQEKAEGSRGGALVLKASSDYPEDTKASFLRVKVPKNKHYNVTNHVIKKVEGLHQSFNDLDSEFYVWEMKMVPGRIESTLHLSISANSEEYRGMKVHIRNLILEFQIDSYLQSGLSVQKVRFLDKKAGDLSQAEIWMRYMTVNKSYVIRMPSA